MKPQKTYSIIRTFMDKHSHLVSASTGIVGGNEKEARYLFNAKVVAYSANHPRVMSLVLVDAAENVIDQWERPVEIGAAA